MCDQLWLTCCAMHNMLLNINGLHENWEQGAQSDWEIFNMQHKDRLSIRTTFAINRLNRHFDSNEEDESSCEEINNNHINKICDKYVSNGKRIVRKMSLALFRQCLVNHFDIRFKRNDIIWPQRIK